MNQEQLSDFMLKCMKFVDKNPKSKIIQEGSHPFSSYLEMEYEEANFKIRFRAQRSPCFNGSCWVKVWSGNTEVFEAQGNFMSEPFNTQAKIYTPGDWENLLK